MPAAPASASMAEAPAAAATSPPPPQAHASSIHPSGPEGRLAFSASQPLPPWFHGRLTFAAGEQRLEAAGRHSGAFLVAENYPDSVYTLVFVDTDGEIRQATISRAERKDGSMGTHFVVEDVPLRECKDVPAVVVHLTRDNGPELPRLRLDQAVPREA